MHPPIHTALFLAFFNVAYGSRIQRRGGGIKTVTATADNIYSTTITAPSYASGSSSYIPSSSLAPQPTTVFVTIPPTSKPKPAGNGKRGLVYNDPSLLGYFNNPDITWTYNWASDPYWGNYPPNTYPKHLIFVPQLWSLDSTLTGLWAANVAKAQSNYKADAVLAFNEPDLCCASCGSTCISPSDAAAGYRQYIQPLRNTLELGAPAVTNGVGPGMGMDWMAQFLAACSHCTIDFMPIHWYGSVTDPESFKVYVRQFHRRFGKPIWITEFGTNSGTQVEILSFLNEVLPWLDRQSWVMRYSYFMDTAGGVPYLLNTDESMTGIGKYYNRG